jgi:hypothetical protein
MKYGIAEHVSYQNGSKKAAAQLTQSRRGKEKGSARKESDDSHLFLFEQLTLDGEFAFLLLGLVHQLMADQQVGLHFLKFGQQRLALTPASQQQSK